MKWLLFFVNPRRYLKYRRIIQDVPAFEAEIKRWRGMIEANPDIHKYPMLYGQRGRHYLLIEDLARMSAEAMTEAEINALAN